MAYKAIDIANFIVKKSLEYKKPLTNLKLQKILYYLQAQFLVETSGVLFSDSIQKWKLGPVVPAVYHEFKSFGSAPIKTLSEQFVIDKDEDGKIKVRLNKFDEQRIEESDQQKITETLVELDEYGAFELVDRTHAQSLWSDYEGRILAGEGDIPYENETIKGYFTQNESEQLWRKQ